MRQHKCSDVSARMDGGSSDAAIVTLWRRAGEGAAGHDVNAWTFFQKQKKKIKQ